MRGLVFTTGGELREQTRDAQPPRVIARIVEDAGGPRARLLCGASEHEILTTAGAAWGFELRDRERQPSGGFEPFRLRRGGRLRVGEAYAALHGRPWSHEGWVLSAPDGSRMDATVTASQDGLSQTRRTGISVDASAAFAVVLDPVGGAASAASLSVAPELLALGCWLIARWHRAPVGDHVLGASAAGTRMPSGSGEVPPAGIRAHAAN